MYTPQNFDHLIGLNGFSDDLLTNHFTLYQGYVKNANTLIEKLSALRQDKVATPEHGEIVRRFGWEWNGMRLHELYFGNLSKTPHDLDAHGDLFQKIARDFGDRDHLEASLRTTLMTRGIGWVILWHDSAADHVFINWINEHDMGHLVGATPLLVIDVFEHAFMLDYGVNRAGYIDTVLTAIDWRIVEGRLTH